jgi:hypothetical protein
MLFLCAVLLSGAHDEKVLRILYASLLFSRYDPSRRCVSSFAPDSSLETREWLRQALPSGAPEKFGQDMDEIQFHHAADFGCFRLGENYPGGAREIQEEKMQIKPYQKLTAGCTLNGTRKSKMKFR